MGPKIVYSILKLHWEYSTLPSSCIVKMGRHENASCLYIYYLQVNLGTIRNIFRLHICLRVSIQNSYNGSKCWNIVGNEWD